MIGNLIWAILYFIILILALIGAAAILFVLIYFADKKDRKQDNLNTD